MLSFEATDLTLRFAKVDVWLNKKKGAAQFVVLFSDGKLDPREFGRIQRYVHIPTFTWKLLLTDNLVEGGIGILWITWVCYLRTQIYICCW